MENRIDIILEAVDHASAVISNVSKNIQTQSKSISGWVDKNTK